VTNGDVPGPEDVPGVSSAGPRLPFLFARGSFIHADPASTYDPATDGIAVRSTTIATARRAVRVGRPVASPPAAAPVRGLASFALARAFWDSLGAPPVTIAVTVHADGSIFDATDATLVGRFYDESGTLPSVVGRVVPAAATTPSNLSGFVVVYDAIAGDQTIGFGDASIDQAPPAAGTVAATVTKLNAKQDEVAPLNASATAPEGISGLSAALVAAHDGFVDSVMAPALAR
jgi:hypothetical protein